MNIRPLTPKDTTACHALFVRAVQEGAAAFYTQEQRDAWAPPHAKAPKEWSDRLTAGHAVCATRWGRLRGFFTMGYDGHIDFAYVAPEDMGKGTAQRLYESCEAKARAWGLSVMDTEASHLAKRFFEKHGWHVTARQVVIRNGVGIDNFRMEKSL